MISEPGERLQGCAERKVRRERVVDVCHPARDGVIRDLFGRPEAADPATIDLDIADPAEVDKMFGHMTIVAASPPASNT